MGMRQPRHRDGLAEETLAHASRAGDRGAQELQGHAPVEPRVARGVDDPHGPLAEQARHLVAADVSARREGPARGLRPFTRHRGDERRARVTPVEVRLHRRERLALQATGEQVVDDAVVGAGHRALSGR